MVIDWAWEKPHLLSGRNEDGEAFLSGWVLDMSKWCPWQPSAFSCTKEARCSWVYDTIAHGYDRYGIAIGVNGSGRYRHPPSRIVHGFLVDQLYIDTCMLLEYDIIPGTASVAGIRSKALVQASSGSNLASLTVSPFPTILRSSQPRYLTLPMA